MFNTVFSTGQSVRPEPGPGRTALCCPVQSFSELTYEKEPRTSTDDTCRPPPPSSSSAVFRRPLRFSATSGRPLHEIVSYRGARRP